MMYHSQEQLRLLQEVSDDDNEEGEVEDGELSSNDDEKPSKQQSINALKSLLKQVV